MRCSTARWCPRPEGLARPSSLGLLGLLLALAPGCVTRGTHEAELERRDRRIAELERSVSSSERAVEAFEAERDAVLAELEALRGERAALEGELAGLEEQLAQRDENLRTLRGTYDHLVTDLEAELAAGQIQVEQLREGIRLNLSQDVLFPLGSAELSSGGRSVVERVAGRVRDGAHTVEVRGHTDDLAIRGALAERYPSNWELAGARAASVVRVLAEGGVDPTLLRATSYGEHAPAVPNADAASRARNRRIEIWLRPLRPPEAPAVAPDAEAPAESPDASPAPG